MMQCVMLKRRKPSGFQTADKSAIVIKNKIQVLKKTEKRSNRYPGEVKCDVD